jgi:hypothetical protein
MIVFDLKCGGGHVFEAWFGSTEDFAAQSARGLVACPICNDGQCVKAAMAPAVPAKGNRAVQPGNSAHPAADHQQAKDHLAAMAAVQASIESQCTWVGRDFASTARALHDGTAPDDAPRGVYGQATIAETRALLDDGVAIAPLPFRSRRAADA